MINRAHLIAAVFYLVTWKVSTVGLTACPPRPIDPYTGSPRDAGVEEAVLCTKTSEQTMTKEFEKKADAEAFIAGAWCKGSSSLGLPSMSCGDFRLEEIHE